jgi:hypothetical protein
MADKKISQLTAATTPLAGTEVLPIVQGNSTVKVSAADITAGRAVSATSVSTGTTDVFAQVGTQLSGGNAILSRFNANNKPAGIYTAGSSGESFVGSNLDWSSGNVFNYKRNGLMWYVGDPGGSGSSVSLGVASGTAGASALVDTAGSVRFRWDTSGNYSLVNGNVVISTAAKGIDFSANTHAAGMTSELLNWYEEGTWTPEYAPETGAFTSITYGFNTARYVRIGSMVWVTWSMRTSALTVGTASGTLYIKNLPFTSRNASPGAFGVLGTSVDFNANNPFAGAVAANDNKITLYRGQTNVVNLVSDLSTGGANNFTAGVICYQA